MNNQIDEFVGKWILIPERSVFQNNSPSLSGVFKCKLLDIHALEVEFNWVDYANQPHFLEYHMVVDATIRPFFPPELFDGICTEMIGKHQLMFSLYMKDTLFSKTKLEIQAEDILKMDECIFLMNGDTLRNVQYFQKVKH
ncbi:hypothetical protein [Sediminitomix flava]|uniref:Uncharacterized protein n=1 Tax=Sediminitomix flava TaxID=379075 RepID=A0A315ZEH0_SEDFL|nr:hypothetical protein [Sediminitomix flava]PWJ43965.1 hypothetical protein BC781_101315 [Sediminitomix flava]